MTGERLITDTELLDPCPALGCTRDGHHFHSLTGPEVFGHTAEELSCDAQGRLGQCYRTALGVSPEAPLTPEPRADDPVQHPPHYTSHPSGIECIQVTEHMNFCLGNATKYLWRAGLKKDALEDLKKARWYIDREIARREVARLQGDETAQPALKVWDEVPSLAALEGLPVGAVVKRPGRLTHYTREADGTWVGRPLGWEGDIGNTSSDLWRLSAIAPIHVAHLP